MSAFWNNIITQCLTEITRVNGNDGRPVNPPGFPQSTTLADFFLQSTEKGCIRFRLIQNTYILLRILQFSQNTEQIIYFP